MNCLTQIVHQPGVETLSYTYDSMSRRTNETRSSTGTRFLFTGREWLAEANLYDYRNRVYSPDLGRFLQTDPIRFSAGDVNLYRYVSNNPGNLTDPTGEVAPLLIWGAWTLAGMAADWLYDEYVDPHVEDLIDEYFDCETQEWVRTAKAGVDFVRMAKNPVKLGVKGLGKGAAKTTTGFADDAAKWIWGQNKGVAKSIRQMDQRGWVPQQVTEAIKTGQQFPATNLVNKANPAIRYVHPTTGQSVVQDTVTKEIIHFGGPGFKY